MMPANPGRLMLQHEYSYLSLHHKPGPGVRGPGSRVWVNIGKLSQLATTPHSTWPVCVIYHRGGNSAPASRHLAPLIYTSSPNLPIVHWDTLCTMDIDHVTTMASLCYLSNGAENLDPMSRLISLETEHYHFWTFEEKNPNRKKAH